MFLPNFTGFWLPFSANLVIGESYFILCLCGPFLGAGWPLSVPFGERGFRKSALFTFSGSLNGICLEKWFSIPKRPSPVQRSEYFL